MALRVMDPSRRPTPRALGIDLGESVEAVMAQALAVQPQERPQDIGLFWGMLKNAAQRDVAAAASPMRKPFESNSDVATTPHVQLREEPNSAVPTAPAPTVAQSHSPLAKSVGLGAESQRLPRYGDSSDSSPASSNIEDRTVVMQVEDIQKMNNVDVDAEPLTPGEELFVTDDQPTQMYREETLAAAGISPGGGWNVDEQLPTMVSAGAAHGHKPIPDTAPMSANPQAPHAQLYAPPPAHGQPPAPMNPTTPMFPPAAPMNAMHAPHAAQAAQAGAPAQAAPYYPQHPFVVNPTHGIPPGNPAVATIPPQGLRAQGAINYATPETPKAKSNKSGASLGLVMIAVFVLVGLLAAAGVYAMGIL
jgi:hypothetical protein